MAIPRSLPHDTVPQTSVMSEKLLQAPALIESNADLTGQNANQRNGGVSELPEYLEPF